MARPKKGEKGHKRAARRWRKTMEERHGGKNGVHRMMQVMGSKGGQTKTSTPKGFAADPKLASIAGAIGGSISSRAGVRNGEGKKKKLIWTREEA